MLERAMREAEAQVPFIDDGKRIVVNSASPKKKKGKKAGAQEKDEETTPGVEMSPHDIQKSELVLNKMARAAMAALCCLVIFASHGLPKQVSCVYQKHG